MNKENNKSAAGLRRSAMAERIRLREEWSALKGQCNETDKQKNVLAKKPQNINNNEKICSSNAYNMRNKDPSTSPINDILRGVVVLVDIGSETKALALRAALMALGASVMPTWNPLVTHVVWSQGGCTKTRAKARALACKLVSPIWVESCAASARRLPESMFPAVSRPSDLPSPCTLRKILKRMDQENIPLNLLSESEEGEKRQPRLRISSETENNTTNTTNDTSQDTSYDKSHDKSKDDVTNVDKNVNTASRRALPATNSPRPKRSKRKLFTQKEADITTSGDESAKETPAPKQNTVNHISKDGRKGLAQAERMARRLLGTPRHKPSRNDKAPRIVLTGMSRQERHDMFHAIRKLNGIVQKKVNKKTTHVLLGSCIKPATTAPNRSTNKSPTIIMCQKCNSPEKILTQMFQKNVTVTTSPQIINDHIICKCNISGVNVLNQSNESQESGSENILRGPARRDLSASGRNMTRNGDNNENMLIIRNDNKNKADNSQSVVNIEVNQNGDLDLIQDDVQGTHSDVPARTASALAGAARGARVLAARWGRHSARARRWLHHFGYEVPHLLKISQKARIERLALNKMSSEYAYDVFNGIKVKVTDNAEQKDAVKDLLNLCGAVTEIPKQDGGQVTQNGGALRHYGGLTLGKRGKKQNEINKAKSQTAQNGGTQPQDGGPTFDITIGREIGEVSSKWVFDSIAAARMRTTRRYINK